MDPARDSRCLLQTSPQVTNPSPAPSIDARVRRCVLEPHHSYIAPINEDAVPGVQVRVDAHRGGHRIESVDVIGIVEVGDNSVGAARGLKLNFFSNAHWDLRDRSVRSLMRGERNPPQAYRAVWNGRWLAAAVQSSVAALRGRRHHPSGGGSSTKEGFTR